MKKQIRLRLDGQDIIDLADGKVLYKEEAGQPRGTGASHTAGEHPVEIVLNTPDQQLLKSMFGAQTTSGVKTSGGHAVRGVWPACPKCKGTAGFSSHVVQATPPVVEITCDACGRVVSQMPLSIP